MLETWFDSDEKPQTEFKSRCSFLQKWTSVDANHMSIAYFRSRCIFTEGLLDIVQIEQK